MDGKLAWGLVDAMTDIGDVVVNSNVANPYYMGQMSAATTPGWMPYRLDDTSGNFPISGPVTACRMAYIYLENVDRVPDMSEEEKHDGKGKHGPLSLIIIWICCVGLGGCLGSIMLIQPKMRWIFPYDGRRTR